jgi:hypothetical protein
MRNSYLRRAKINGPRLFDGDRNGLTGKTPAQVEEEVLQGFRRVFECAELFLLGGGRDQTQIVFGIGPINSEKSGKIGHGNLRGKAAENAEVGGGETGRLQLSEGFIVESSATTLSEYSLSMCSARRSAKVC